MIKFYFLLVAVLLFSFHTKAQSSVDFSANKTSGCGALAGVKFTDESTISATSWYWDFGNSTNSTLQNPTASYANVGSYTVSLTITNSSGNYTETKTNYIQVYKKPTSDFSISDSSGCNPLKVVFSDSSILGDAGISKYVWDFGDGSPENNSQNPTYTYKNKGNYNVSLQVVDSNGCTNTKQFSSIQIVDRPNAVFSTSNSPYSCSVPYQVDFVNYTQGPSNTTYLWDFGDGSTSIQKAPSHSYTSLGDYNVTLIATTQHCSDTAILKDFISLQPISASFEVNKDTSCFGEKLEFTSSATGASAYLWDFGDGSFSRHPNPTKIYKDSGTFIVNLRASSGSACVVNVKDTIYTQKVIAKFEMLEDTACNLPANMKFINNSINANQFEWTLDGEPYKTFNTDTLGVEFLNYGVFNDRLIATSKLGCADTLVKNKHRVIYDPYPQMHLLSPDAGCAPIDVEFAYGYIHPDSVVSQIWTYDTNEYYQDTSIITFPDHGLQSVYLSIKNARGCIGKDTIKVRVGDKLNLDSLILPDTMCAGDTLFIPMPIVDTSKSLKYKLFMTWESSNNTETVFYDKEMEISPLSDTGNVFLKHEVNYYGCYTSSNKDTIYSKGPIATFNTSPSDCNGSLLFNFTSEMIGVDKFYWDFGDGSPLDSVNTDPDHTYAKDSVYIVSLHAINSDSSCRYIFEKEVSTGPPPIPEIMFSTKDVCASKQFFISASVKNNYSTLKWQLDDSVFYDTTFFILSRDTAAVVPIKLVAISEYGCADSVLENFTFHKPTADFTSDYVGGCLPINITFMDLSTGSKPISKWFWDISPFGKSAKKNPDFTIDRSMDISASLIITDDLGCKDTASKVNMHIIKQNNLSFKASDNKICTMDTVFFTNTSAIFDSNYVWLFGDGDSLKGYHTYHVYDSSGKFSVTLKYKDLQGCINEEVKINFIHVEKVPIADFISDTSSAPCYPLPVTFMDQSESTDIKHWEWDFGDNIQSNFKNPFHNYLLPGNYDVKLLVSTPNGCIDSITKTSYINISGPEAEISSTPDTSCINGDIVFQMINDVGVESFQWNFDDGNTSLLNPATHSYASTGVFYPVLLITDSGNVCPKVITDTIYIKTFKASYSISDTVVCMNTPIDFINTTANLSQLNWDFGDGNSSSTPITSHNYADSGNYVVKLSVVGNNACKDSAIQNIRVNPNPMINELRDTIICFGDSIQLLASGGTVYEWTPPTYLNNANIPNPIAFPQKEIDYKVVVGNQYDCFDSTEMSIKIAKQPVSDLQKDTLLIIGESLYIHNDSTNPAGFTYEWSPDSGLNCVNCPNPLAKPMSTTLYILNIQDPLGCYSIYDSVLISIKEAYTLNIPKAFTPNNDGNNDVVYARGWGIKELLEFKIYNRWGELVFESNDVNTGWDGYYNDKLQGTETYVYIVRALMYDDQIISKKGNISLIR